MMKNLVAAIFLLSSGIARAGGDYYQESTGCGCVGIGLGITLGILFLIFIVVFTLGSILGLPDENKKNEDDS